MRLKSALKKCNVSIRNTYSNKGLWTTVHCVGKIIWFQANLAGISTIKVLLKSAVSSHREWKKIIFLIIFFVTQAFLIHLKGWVFVLHAVRRAQKFIWTLFQNVYTFN